MAIVNKRSFITKRIKNILGYPIIAHLESEPSDIDFDEALLRLYTANPIIRHKVYAIPSGSTQSREVIIDVDETIKSEYPPTPGPTKTLIKSGSTFTGTIEAPVKGGSVVIKRDGATIATDNAIPGTLSGTDGATTISGSVNLYTGAVTVIYPTTPPSGTVTADYMVDRSYEFYMLGVCNVIFRPFGYLNYGYDQYLLGVNINVDPLMSGNPLKELIQLTAEDKIAGEPTVEIRWNEGVKGKIYVICSGTGTFEAWLAFGDNNVERVPFHLLEIVSDLVAEEYLQRVYMARGGVSIQADFAINADIVKAKIDELHQKNIDSLRLIAGPTILWG